MTETYLTPRAINKIVSIQRTYLYYLAERGFIKTKPHGGAGRNRLYSLEDTIAYRERPNLTDLVKEWLKKRYPDGLPTRMPMSVAYDCAEEIFVCESTFRYVTWQMRKEQHA